MREISTDPEIKKFFAHMCSAPENWYSTTLSDGGAKFDEAWDWVSDNFSPSDWTIVKDDFVFLREQDAARFIFTFCI